MRLTISRGIVHQVVDDVKTEGSAKAFKLTRELLDRLVDHKTRAEFAEPDGWISASPIRLGILQAHLPLMARCCGHTYRGSTTTAGVRAAQLAFQGTERKQSATEAKLLVLWLLR